MEQLLKADRLELRGLLQRFLPDATQDELEQLAGAWGPEVDHDRVSRLSWKMLLARWVELAPQRALALEKALDTWGLNGWCLQVWAVADPLEALAAARREEDAARAIRLVAGEVARQNLSVALALIDEFPRDESILKIVFGEWARRDPKAALARVESLSGSVRKGVRETILTAMGEESPELALAQIRESEGNLVAQLGDQAAVLEAMIQDNPSKATPHVLTMPRGKKRYQTLLSLARKRAEQDPEGTLSWGKSLPEGSEKQAVIAVAASKLDLDLNGLVSLLDEVGWHHAERNPQDVEQVKGQSGSSGSFSHSGSLRQALRTAVGKATKKEDLPVVLEALSKLPYPSGIHHDSWLARLGESWVSTSPAMLTEVFRAVPDKRQVVGAFGSVTHAIRDSETLLHFEPLLDEFEPAQRGQMLHSFIRAYGRLDPLEATAWAQALSDPDERTQALHSSLRELSEADFEAAITVLETVEDPKIREDVIPRVVQEMGARDVSRAFFWVENLPESEVTPRIYRQLAADWFRSDSLAASEWVSQLPEGDLRDGAAEALVSGLSQGSRPDFEAALAWAQTLGQSRERYERGILSSWLRRDRPSALEAMGRSSLPEQVQEELRNRPQ